MNRTEKFLVLCLLLTLTLHASRATKLPSCEIEIISEWISLDDREQEEAFGEKWVLAGKFVIKKRSNDLIYLNEINLKWCGAPIPSLTASLFRADGRDALLLPIEQNLICDGHWNNPEQILQLRFQEKEYLGPTTTLCLVLAVPAALEPLIMQGHFAIVPHSLPYQLKDHVSEKTLKISSAPTITPEKYRIHS